MTKLFYQGHSACAGCPEAIAIHTILEVAGPNTIISNATGCTEIVSTPYPKSSWAVPYVHAAFETAASVASGIEAALKKMNKEANVIALAGDGATYDIGLQALSGMLERGHKVCYICLNNEAYMNTGVQRSSATPYCSWTTTSPSGRESLGNDTWKKPITEIMAAHQIPYAATASIGDINDLKQKLKKALLKENQPSFLDIHCPCPVGWKFESFNTLNIAKLAIETGIWVLYEIEHGQLKITKEPSNKPVDEYLKMQGRFKHLTSKEIAEIQKRVDNDWQKYKQLQQAGVKI